MSRFPSDPRALRSCRAALRGLLCAFSLASLLSACGGGSTSASPALAADGSASAADATAVHALAASPAASINPDTNWTTVAAEGQHFNVPGTQAIRYGTGTAWVYQSITGSGDCSNPAFGTDPAQGIVKACQQAADTGTVWTPVATEGGSFTVTGTQTVRYGSGSAWVTLQVTGSGNCTNAAFGTDPLVGVVKACQVSTGSSGWTVIAAENASFTVAAAQTVRYGIGAHWLTKTLTGAATCSNAFFGSDPAVGTAKECDLGIGAASTSPVPVAGVCTAPAAAADTSATAPSVGDGTPASCTEAAFRAAVAAQSVVRFNCGAGPATIKIVAPIEVPAGRDSVIDGDNRVTLDGGGTTRILSVKQANYRTNRHGLTLQHIALRNGHAVGGGYVAPDPAHPACGYGYATGGGGAIEVRDARLWVVDVDFQNNAAATPGPDIGGGAIYAVGSLDVLVAGSRFSGNSGSNAGALGMLNSNLNVYNSTFQGNTANGLATPSGSTASCPGVAYAGQGGAGGGGGAIDIDGGDDTDVVVCGSSFTGNHANALAGAFFRTPDRAARHTTLDRSVFAGNTASQGGALYVLNSAPLDILASTFSGNTATTFGAAQLQGDRFNIVNSTFSGNEATHGVGGALGLNGSDAASVIQNTTFADNKASGGAGYFSAAIFGDANFAVLNSVFANNTGTDPYNPMQCGFASASGSADVQWPAVRAVGGAADTPCVSGIRFADPLLGPLADNGGPTPTRLPTAASALRNSGRNCPATDQRGNPRKASSCTIGAVE